MGNKNKHVIISYFSDQEAATEAAKQLKKWDKANNDIKLGGVGVLTWKKNKIKTRKVGARAGGTGAKWGLALGAVTGILSGGVTLIGGAVAGVAGGAVLGALFHKNLGLTDADKERLEQHLQGGGAAVALLYAPSSGEELRMNIKTQADSQYAKLQDDWQKGMTEMQSRMDKMSSDLQAMAGRSKDTGKPA